jgi:hypothetical protein
VLGVVSNMRLPPLGSENSTIGYRAPGAAAEAGFFVTVLEVEARVSSVGGMSTFASFEIFECDGAFDILPGCTVCALLCALLNYETDKIRIRSSGRETVQRAPDRQGQTTRGTRAGSDGVSGHGRAKSKEGGTSTGGTHS